MGDDENLRDVLSFYGLKRMTSTVKSNFMEAIKTRFIHVEEYFGQSNKPGVPDLEKELETSKVAIDQDVKILTKIPHNETGYEIVLRSTDASVICTITISSHMVTNEEENFYNYDHPFSQNLNGKGVGDEVAHPLYGGNFKIIKISTSQQTENKDDLSGPSKYFPKS